MHGMSETYQDFTDDSAFAYSVIANIAILGSKIPESMMRLYMAPVNNLVDDGLMLSSAAYFHGADILSVECDCTSQSPLCLVEEMQGNDFYISGQDDKLSAAPMYNRAVSDITSLRHSLY